MTADLNYCDCVVLQANSAKATCPQRVVMLGTTLVAAVELSLNTTHSFFEHLLCMGTIPL